jgi:hypothetical protein
VAVGAISVTLKGSLSSSPATCNGVGTAGSSGPSFRLSLPASAAAATNDESTTSRTVDSAVAFEDLGLPPNLRATVFYLSVQTLSPFTVEMTYETTGVVVRTVAGSGGLILETPASDDRISLVRVQGQGDLEWYAAGGIV